jgi:hypothetical protein
VADVDAQLRAHQKNLSESSCIVHLNRGPLSVITDAASLDRGANTLCKTSAYARLGGYLAALFVCVWRTTDFGNAGTSVEI